MREKPRALIIGAGAVGRGLLAPTLIDSEWRVTFYDTNETVMRELAERKWYPLVGRGQTKWIGPVSTAYSGIKMCPLDQYQAIFISVKAQNLTSVAGMLQAVATRFGNLAYEDVNPLPPIFLVENLMNAPQKFKKMCEPLEVDTYGSIANVIVPTSPMAEDDPLFTVYDPNMELVISTDCNNVVPVIDHACYIPPHDFDMEMDMKMFLHCSLHVLAAYLGMKNNIEYIHEVISDPRTKKKVYWGLNIIVDALRNKYPNKKSQIRKRAKFEIQATGDKLFWDDVYRVGRDPERKLEWDDRLIGLLIQIERHLLDLSNGNIIGYKTIIEVTCEAIKLSRYGTPDCLEHYLLKNNLDGTTATYVRGIIRNIKNYGKQEGLF